MIEKIIGVLAFIGFVSIYWFLTWVFSREKPQKSLEEIANYAEMQALAKQKAELEIKNLNNTISENFKKGELCIKVNRKILIGLLRSTTHNFVELQLDMFSLFVNTPNLSAKTDIQINYKKTADKK